MSLQVKLPAESQPTARRQRQVLALRLLPGMNFLFSLWYRLGQWALTRFALRRTPVQAVYLRRGAGRGELVAGASDLDFFLVIGTYPAETEMAFLKTFWAGYHRLRRFFPFLGEVLMGDANELHHWLASGTARAYETRFSWKLLAGKDFLIPPAQPDLRDIFSECLKLYADLLQALLKTRPEDFHAGIRPFSASAIQLRHSAKAALDLYRWAAVAEILQQDPAGAFRLMAATRSALCSEFSEPGLRNLLALQPRVLQEDPFALFSRLCHRGLLALHGIAAKLSLEEQNGFEASLTYSAARPSDPYSLSVRELFAERTLLRHSGLVSRVILSEATTGLYLTLPEPPSIESLRALLLDLRDVGFSFERFSVAMPLTETTFRELERTSLLDSPFHAFSGHRELFLENEQPVARAYAAPAVQIPRSVLRKTFSELNFGLRLEPRELEHFLEKIVAVVLGLRLATGHREISTDFFRTLERYGERYPLRIGHLREKIHPYLGEEAPEVWGALYASLDSHGKRLPAQASYLRARLEQIRQDSLAKAASATRPSDLWINLTPFLRMEMNAMKDQFYDSRPELKL